MKSIKKATYTHSALRERVNVSVLICDIMFSSSVVLVWRRRPFTCDVQSERPETILRLDGETEDTINALG